MDPEIVVMFVEDDPDIRTVVEMALSRDQKIVMYTIDCGGAALDFAEQFERSIDVVLLNVMLPDMSGLEVAQALRTFPSTAKACLALVTASVSDEQIASYRFPDIAEVIVKPFDAVRLPERVRSLVRA